MEASVSFGWSSVFEGRGIFSVMLVWIWGVWKGSRGQGLLGVLGSGLSLQGVGYVDQHSGALRPPTHICPPPECAPRSGHLLLRPGAVPVRPSPAGDAGQHGGGWRGGEAPSPGGPGGGRGRGGTGRGASGLPHHLLFFLSLPRPSQALNLDKWVGLALGVTCPSTSPDPRARLLGPHPAHRGWGSPHSSCQGLWSPDRPGRQEGSKGVGASEPLFPTRSFLLSPILSSNPDPSSSLHGTPPSPPPAPSVGPLRSQDGSAM